MKKIFFFLCFVSCFLVASAQQIGAAKVPLINNANPNTNADLNDPTLKKDVARLLFNEADNQLWVFDASKPIGQKYIRLTDTTMTGDKALISYFQSKSLFIGGVDKYGSVKIDALGNRYIALDNMANADPFVVSATTDVNILTQVYGQPVRRATQGQIIAPAVEIKAVSALPALADTKIGNKQLYITTTDTTELTYIGGNKWMADIVRGSSTPSISITSGTQTIDYSNAIWKNPNLTIGKTFDFIPKEGIWLPAQDITAESFGANGNDSFDDYQSLIAYFNYCNNTQKSYLTTSGLYIGNTTQIKLGGYQNCIYYTSRPLPLAFYPSIDGQNSIIKPFAGYPQDSFLIGGNSGANAWYGKIENLQFDGFKRTLRLESTNIDVGLIRVDNCNFYGSDCAIRFNNPSGLLNISNCRFFDIDTALQVINAEIVNFKNNWVSERTGIAHIKGAAIYSNCTMEMETNIFVPGLAIDPQRAWINNYYSIRVHNLRQGGETGAHTLVNNFAKMDVVAQPIHRRVEVSNIEGYGGFGTYKIGAIRLFEIPNFIEVHGYSGCIESSLIDYAEGINGDSLLLSVVPNANNQIPKIFTFANTCGSFVNNQLLPNNLLKYTNIDNKWSKTGDSLAAGQFFGSTNNEDVEIRKNNILHSRFTDNGGLTALRTYEKNTGNYLETRVTIGQGALLSNTNMRYVIAPTTLGINMFVADGFTGNIGINQYSPIYPLHITKAISTAIGTTGQMMIENGNTADSLAGARILFAGSSTTGYATITAAKHSSFGVNSSNFLDFGTFYNGAPATILKLSTYNNTKNALFYGNIGINTITPQHKLDIDAQSGSAGNPLRLLGLNQGASTDSILTSLNGVVRRNSLSDLSLATVIKSANAVVNIPAITGMGTIGTVSVTVTGAIVGMQVSASPRTNVMTSGVSAPLVYVSAANTVTFSFSGLTVGTNGNISSNWDIVIQK
jgi:hypothetical protein